MPAHSPRAPIVPEPRPGCAVTAWGGAASRIGLTKWCSSAHVSAKIWIEKRRTNIPADMPYDVTSLKMAKINISFQIAGSGNTPSPSCSIPKLRFLFSNNFNVNLVDT